MEQGGRRPEGAWLLWEGSTYLFMEMGLGPSGKEDIYSF